jgi:hypothetical protein
MTRPGHDTTIPVTQAVKRPRRKTDPRDQRSGAELRKGPRGGGRDRDKLIDHVIGAETAYARKLGVKPKQPAIDDIAAIEELREAITAVVGAPSDGSPVLPDGWTTPYAARRIAWHVLEHAWEMQDRAESEMAPGCGPRR